MSDPNLARLPPLREVIARHDLGAKRSLGQNFLLDLNLTRRIARAAGDLAAGTTIEIGPGPGGLTRALLEEGAGRLVVIEKDRRFLPALEEIADLAGGRMTIQEADALKVDLEDLGEAPRRVVANLPYNVANKLLTLWLDHLAERPELAERFVLLFQKEVAARLVAQPGEAAYGRLSVLTGWLTEARRLFDIPPTAFVPAPKVTSTLVALDPRPMPRAEAAPRLLAQVTGAAFGQRRKMLRQSLKSLAAPAEELIAAAGLDPTQRAETVSIEGYCALARALSAHLNPE